MRRNGFGCAAVMFNQQAVVGGGWGGGLGNRFGGHAFPGGYSRKGAQNVFLFMFFFLFIYSFSALVAFRNGKHYVFAELFSLTRNTKPKTPLAKICKVLFFLFFLFFNPKFSRPQGAPSLWKRVEMTGGCGRACRSRSPAEETGSSASYSGAVAKTRAPS